MKPELYQFVPDNEVNSLWLEKPDIEDQDLVLGRTTLGATALVRVDVAPTFLNPLDNSERPYFSEPCRLQLVLSSRLRRSDDAVCKILTTQFQALWLLVRGLHLPSWCHVGTATLGPVFGRNGIHWNFTYELAQRLPYDIWTRVGGYEKWLLAVGGHEHLCSTAQQCMALVRAMWGTVGDDVYITHYDGDSLLAIARTDRKCVVFHYKEDEFDDTSVNATYQGDPNDKVTFYTSRGDEINADASWVITNEAAMRIIERFVSTGTPGSMVVGAKKGDMTP